MKVNKLFVYGTLKQYGPFRRFLKEGSIVAIGRGKIRARRVRFRYPAVVEDKKNHVTGEIFEMRDPAKVLPVLDRYEEFDPKNRRESLYIRKVKKATLENKKSVYVFVYMLNRPPTNKKKRPGLGGGEVPLRPQG